MAYPLPLDTFHPFPRLPKELRIEIWKVHLAALEPRLLRVWCKVSTEPIEDSKDPEDGHERYVEGEQHQSSPNPVPALLHTSQESRYEARRHYTRAFSLRNGSTVHQRYIWTNFATDTIKIKVGSFLRINKEERKRIQHMSIDTDCPICFYGSLTINFNLMENFKYLENLKHLEILCPSPLWSWGGAVKELTDGFRECFGESIPGYVPPDVRFVQTGTWWEMDIHNYADVLAYGTEQRSLARARWAAEGRS
ncbi:hypothetical protein IFR05_013651 [Cadophora sp. M221]|nr:hypothetical protein IFR05_013651 [Cadophora sp. M221]